jgi:Fungal protein kinase
VTPLASQGTWKFIAAALLRYLNIQHSFVHDLESFFYVLLYLGILYLPSTWVEAQRSNFLDCIMNSRRFGERGVGGMGKWCFMHALGGMDYLAFTSNDPLTKLVFDFKKMLATWYTKKTILPSFVSTIM